MILRDLLQIVEEEQLDETAEIYLVQYGYRSSETITTEGAAVVTDERKQDDWGNEMPDPQPALYIRLGHTADKRYPPSELRDLLNGE